MDSLDIYLQNAELLLPYYSVTLCEDEDTEEFYWHSSDIKTRYAVVNTNGSYGSSYIPEIADDYSIGLKVPEIIKLFLGEAVINRHYTEHVNEMGQVTYQGVDSTIRWDKANRELIVNLGDNEQSVDDTVLVQYFNFVFCSEFGMMLLNHTTNEYEAQTEGDVTDLVYTQNGLIYGIDSKVMEALALGNRELYCIAYDGNDGDLHLGRVAAFTKVNIETLLLQDGEIEVSLTKNETEDGTYCEFDSDLLLKTQVGVEHYYTVKTQYGLAGLSDIDKDTIFEGGSGSENFVNGNFKADDSTKYSLKLSGTPTGNPIGTIKLRVLVRNGTFANNMFSVGTKTEDGEEVEMTSQIIVTLKLNMPAAVPEEPHDAPEPEDHDESEEGEED